MKKCSPILSLLFCTICPAVSGQGTTVDKITIGDGKRLHFRVVEGRKNDVILFESGGGDAVNVWTDLLPEIEKATGATLVTYDRPGFGESEINPANHGFESDMERLEDGLKDLGYSGPFVIVAHSLGGFYAVLFASRHPQEVKAIVMIDANLARFFTDDCLATIRTPPKQLQDYQRSAPGKYCFSLDYEPMARQMRSVRIPASIPVLDLVAGRQSQSSPADADRWRSCHAAFAAEASNRTEITAYGSGHYIYRSNPEMVVAAVAAEHAIANKEPVTGWMYAAITLNELKRKDEQLAHSETGLNQWGYDELRNGDKTGAVKIFELNSALHTSSANVWDSLGDGYEALGDTQSALKSYQKTVEGTHN